MTSVALTVGKLVAAGTCLGVGFWMSKKLTGVADYYLILWDERRKQRKLQGVEL